MVEQDGGGLKRIGTGEPRLDRIMNGGFPSNSLNIVMGPPGTGKTILVQQILFQNVGEDRPVIYLSTLSEPIAKVVTYLQQFGFYDESKMMDRVIYEDVGAALLEDGSAALLDRIRELIRTREPTILVVDSYKAIHDLARDEFEMRQLSAQLGRLVSAYDVTTFLVGEYGETAVSRYPEFAVADGIVQMIREPADNRENRHLRVLKLRGSNYLQGSHAFSISHDGIHVYPRLVTPLAPERYGSSGEKLSTGVEGLDALLQGGAWRGTSTIVLGPSGAGKTTLGLLFAIQGARTRQRSLYLNFQENPRQLQKTADSLDPALDEHLDRTLFFLYRSPVEMQIDAVVVELFEMVDSQNIERVVIDALGDLELAAASRERFHDYLYSVVQHLAARGVTSFLLLEGHEDLEYANRYQDRRFSTLSDAIIALGYAGAKGPNPVRTLRVVKARNTAHALARQQMDIHHDGVRLSKLETP